MAFNDISELADLGSTIVRYRRNRHELDIFQIGTEADGFTPVHISINGDKSIEKLRSLLGESDSKVRQIKQKEVE